MRLAVYATPAPDSALGRLAALWLGRDAFTGEATRPALPERDKIVAEPARYGFHATLRAPFRPVAGVGPDAAAARLASLCAGRPQPVVRRLVLARLGTFFALVPAEPEPAIHALEGDVLDAFEPLRAPLAPDEVVRRRPEHLSERQRRNLATHGYPFVREDFRFHLTLTGAVDDADDEVARALAAHFAAVLERPLPLDGLGLFVEPGPGAPFRVHAFHPFGPATGAASPASP